MMDLPPRAARRRAPCPWLANAARAAGLGLSLATGAAAGAAPPSPPAPAQDAPWGTQRVLVLKRQAAAYGRVQHAPLPLAPGEVVLSFDDGPSPESTPAVLAALQAEGAKAVFFMNGAPLLRSPDLGRQVRAQGHAVAMHGHEHLHSSAVSPQAQLADLAKMEQAFATVFGGPAPAWRYPFLEATPVLDQALAQRGLTVMSVDLGIDDWLPDQSPAMLTERLLERLKPLGGGLILMHDAQPQTARALPMMLRAMKAAGYRLVEVRWEAL